MPAYNFKLQFAAAVAFDRKRQTIRPRRKRPTRPGEPLYLFTGQRTVRCRRLKNTRCKEVLPLDIYPDKVVLNGRPVAGFALLELARADGFDSIEGLISFFETQYGLPLIDTMELISW